MASMQIITGRERRRSWSEGQKRAIVAAAFAPGTIVADVARRAEICAGQIYRWRQELGCTERGFSEVVIAAVDDRSRDRGALGPAPAIEIEFAGRARLHIAALTPPELAAAVVKGCGPMIPVPTGVRVWIAIGHTDMRRGMNGLALQIQQGLKRDPHAGDLFVFRGGAAI